MLVLTRKPGETIRIGDDIVITISQLKGGRVRIGIDAPPEMGIRRGELEVRDEKDELPAAIPFYSHAGSHHENAYVG
ncbi:carbon storage regulator [Blastopirellula marina]|uniref:Translational regulator CsrA n=1 Tax=Blastopirellula marina DSM 3645 TaxID=314230 RepID=A3ZTA9_9BACT|nr:carbon storage regulator [Blastopirellula marina]EAQ80162.1 probable CsrA_thema carbon storage regulator-like protein [Blastopirellula marina DSM 3645]